MSLKETAVVIFMGAALGLAAAFAVRMQPQRKFLPDELTCLMEIKHYDDTTKGLISGYNYFLLREYSKHSGIKTHIRLTSAEENALDSLKTGSADLVIIPFEEALEIEDVRLSLPVDSLTYWVVRHGEKHLLRDINQWLDAYHASEESAVLRKKFIGTYDPYRRASNQNYICPYDDIIKANADSLGWDWRLLAAVIYQESHFRISVRSRRGAVGLMQVMPTTAESLGVEDLLDPETNINAGSRYLKKLDHYFRDIEEPIERAKMTLAAYNAGEGRIFKCREFARERGFEANTWDEIVPLIPDMEDFKGVETTAYVERVMSLYWQFIRICPQK